MQKILEKISKLNINKKRPEALKLVLFELEKKPDNKDLLAWKAFLLFHIAIDPKLLKPYSAEDMIADAINIYEKIIDITSDKKQLNARMYLAQIYAYKGDSKSINLAEKNYKEYPSSLTLNRLIGVYKRMSIEKEKIEEKIELYHKEAIKEKLGVIFIYCDMASFWKGIDSEKESYYINKLKKYKPGNKEEEAMKDVILNK